MGTASSPVGRTSGGGGGGCLFVIVVVGIVVLIGQENPGSKPIPSKELAKGSGSQPQIQQPSVAATEAIPADVAYTIINTGIIPGIKRSLEIRLDGKVQEDVLRSIALELKARDPQEYERTFIGYYLPDMEVGAGAWATTHFNPDLEVQVLGLTVNQEKDLISEPEDLSRDIVGTWLDESPGIGGKITIYRQDGKFYIELQFKDGSSSSEEIVKRASTSDQQFEEKSGSRFGEYYVIDKQGNLQIRDDDGLIKTARVIK